MTIFYAIVAAIIVAICWGLGDFFIQKSTRRVGDWETLFIITAFGSVALAPFVWKDFVVLFDGVHNTELLVGLGTGIVLLFATLFTMQGMKVGKLAVVESLYPLEIVTAGILSYFILNENLSVLQVILIVALIACFFLLSFKESGHFKLHRFIFERGIILVIAGMIIMGIADLLMGWGARITNPLLVNFMANIIMAIVTLIYLIQLRRLSNLFSDVRHYTSIFLGMALFDNVAWVLYAWAMSVAPIAIVTALTESSILIGVLFGLFVNKEKLSKHQKVGVFGAFACGIMLGIFS